MNGINDSHKSNGFLWGLAIGASLTALIGSKKGRAFLKELSQAASEIFQDFLEEKNINIKSFIEEEEEIIAPVSGEEGEIDKASKENNISKPVKKRLFKGVRK